MDESPGESPHDPRVDDPLGQVVVVVEEEEREEEDEDEGGEEEEEEEETEVKKSLRRSARTPRAPRRFPEEE